jgi:hypothetical protein
MDSWELSECRVEKTMMERGKSPDNHELLPGVPRLVESTKIAAASRALAPVSRKSVGAPNC